MRVKLFAFIVLALGCAVFAAGLSGATSAVAAGVSAGTSAQAADEPEPDSLCAPGQPAVLYGTDRADKLVGKNGNDVICGLGGNDQIDGGGGNDVIDGGAGNDNLSGGPGNDQLYGGDGDDSIEGAVGDDGLFGGAGADALSGASGNDGLAGGDGNDSLSGATGNDSLDGGRGNDALGAASGDDTLDGKDGTDTLDAASGDDICLNGESLSGCDRGADALDPLASPMPIDGASTAAPNTITVDDAFPGVSLELDTGGGVYPWDVSIEPARAYMGGRVADAAMVSPAFDISVPTSAPPIRGGRLTLPYDPGRLGGYPESDLRVFTFDTKAQLWVPVAGNQTVDTQANTVTTPLAHLSVYAVMKVLTAAQWAEVFGKTPVRCTAGNTGGAGIDVVFLVDISGSMSSNDPTGLRVDAAKAFVDGMRSQDRAAVVGFDGAAHREIGLTNLDNQGGIDAVKSALERTRVAIDGTDISTAVRDAVSILSNNGGGGRLRVAVLLTDGQSPYDTTLTTQARDDAIEIHTVGLGAGTDEDLLRGIADGTGASYRHLDDPAALPELYRQLAGDIVGGGADTDGDGLSDCVERNGLFVPWRISFPLIGGGLDFASFITTDPTNKDTDGDGIEDGKEVIARDLSADPELAGAYHFLIDQGLTTYYKLIADPTKKDSDGDGADDLTELLNGTDPLVPDDNELGIDGLDLPPFTLFQPSRYTAKPAVDSRLEIATQPDGSRVIKRVFYNDHPVTYDTDRTCVETCDAVRKLAADRPDDNGWGVCIFGVGDCVDDTSQEHDIVEEARVKQAIFDRDGNLDERFLQEQVALQCALWFSDQQNCFDNAATLDFPDSVPPSDLTKFLAAGTIAIPVPGTANPETARRIAELLAKSAAAVAAGITAAQLTDAVAKCIEGPALSVVKQLLPFVHPCQQLPTYAPGGDVKTAAEHRVAAIAGNPARVLERYASPADRSARPFPRRWYLGQPGCTAADQGSAQATYGVPVACDEFPNWSMENAGPGASLKYIPATDNSGEGTRLNTFLSACADVARSVNPLPFLVVPVPSAPVTVFHCGT